MPRAPFLPRSPRLLTCLRLAAWSRPARASVLRRLAMQPSIPSSRLDFALTIACWSQSACVARVVPVRCAVLEVAAANLRDGLNPARTKFGPDRRGLSPPPWIAPSRHRIRRVLDAQLQERGNGRPLTGRWVSGLALFCDGGGIRGARGVAQTSAPSAGSTPASPASLPERAVARRGRRERFQRTAVAGRASELALLL